MEREDLFKRAQFRAIKSVLEERTTSLCWTEPFCHTLNIPLVFCHPPSAVRESQKKINQDASDPKALREQKKDS